MPAAKRVNSVLNAAKHITASYPLEVGLGTVFFLAAFFSFLGFTFGIHFKWCGLILQLLGISSVLLSIHEIRKFYDRESLIEYLLRIQKPKIISGTLKMDLPTLEADITYTDNHMAASLEDRVKRLEEITNSLRHELKNEQVKRKDAHTAIKNQQEKSLLTFDQEIHSQLEERDNFALSGRGLEIVATIWLIFGTIIAGFG